MSYSTTLPGGLTLHVLYILTLMATINTTPRRRINLFVGCTPNRIETGRRYSSGGRFMLGFRTTASSDDPRGDTYQVTSIELGARSDHLADAMLGDEVTPQYIAECNEYEAQFAEPEGYVHAAAERRIAAEELAADKQRELDAKAADKQRKVDSKVAAIDAERKANAEAVAEPTT